MKRLICFAISLIMLLSAFPAVGVTAADSKEAAVAITNIFMQLGSNITERNFTWFSASSEKGFITYAKADAVIGGKFPSDAKTVAATRNELDVVATNPTVGSQYIDVSRVARGDTASDGKSFTLNKSASSAGVRIESGAYFVPYGYSMPDGVSLMTAKGWTRWGADQSVISTAVPQNTYYPKTEYQVDNIKIEYVKASDGSNVTLFSQTYEDSCTADDMAVSTYGVGTVVSESDSVKNKVMKITPSSDNITLISSTQSIESDKYTITFDMRAVSPNAGLVLAVKNPYHSEHSSLGNGFSLLITPGNFVSKGADGKYSTVDDEWYTYTVEVDVEALDNLKSVKEGYFNNKATITGLEPGCEYSYQLSNGTDVSEIYTFKVGEESSSFSFAFLGDTQIGGYSAEETARLGARWGLTLDQLTASPVFEGIDFVATAGDQINTNQTTPNYLDNSRQYDAYFNQEEIPGLAMTSLLGNHDNWAQGGHYQHFNEPNYIIDKSTGEYYGSAKDGSDLNGADYWFTYNSVLFVALSVHDMDDNKTGTASARAVNKAAADKHLEFIDKVLELNANNDDILWKIILVHESAYGSSYHANYTLDANGGYTARPEQYMFVDMKEYLFPGIYDRGFDVVLSGHDHVYTRSHILKHEAIDTNGMYYGNETVTPYENTSGSNYYTYADGTTTPTFVDFTDVNGVVHTDKKVASQPVKVTDPDGLLHITAAGSSSGLNPADYPSIYAATVLGSGDTETRGMSRMAIRIDVTPTTMTFTNYGLGTSTANVNCEDYVLDTFTIEKTPSSGNEYLGDFKDVHSGHSYYDAVKFVVSEGLFNGTSATTFEPNTTMNRAMFVTVLGRLDKADVSKYTEPSFSDVKAGEWYTSYVEWAAANGIVNGIGGGKYGVTGEITVEQACTVLYRYADGKTAAEKSGKNVTDFTDGDSVSSWATTAVEWAVENGIYEGIGDALSPTSAASRWLVATMFANYARTFGA